MRQNEIFELIKLKFPKVLQDESAKALVLPKQLLLEVAAYSKSGELAFDDLHCVTAVDRKDKIELIYIFCASKMRDQLILKIYLSADYPQIESLAKLYRSADWFEREVFDLFGVKFINHPNLSRILNPSDWKGYPLRKDYTHPELIKKAQY